MRKLLIAVGALAMAQAGAVANAQTAQTTSPATTLPYGTNGTSFGGVIGQSAGSGIVGAPIASQPVPLGSYTPSALSNAPPSLFGGTNALSPATSLLPSTSSVPESALPSTSVTPSTTTYPVTSGPSPVTLPSLLPNTTSAGSFGATSVPSFGAASVSTGTGASGLGTSGGSTALPPALSTTNPFDTLAPR